jgi:hypothetical protein
MFVTAQELSLNVKAPLAVMVITVMAGFAIKMVAILTHIVRETVSATDSHHIPLC